MVTISARSWLFINTYNQGNQVCFCSVGNKVCFCSVSVSFKLFNFSFGMLFVLHGGMSIDVVKVLYINIYYL